MVVKAGVLKLNEFKGRSAYITQTPHLTKWLSKQECLNLNESIKHKAGVHI